MEKEHRLTETEKQIAFLLVTSKYLRLMDHCTYDGAAKDLAANGVTVQKWIPVTERLPEENERVLACYINPLRKDRPPRMMVGEGTSTQIVKGKVYLWCGGWRSITHWMPLPEPPEKDGR